MYYNAFQSFDEVTKEMLEETTAFEYAKNEFEKYHSTEDENNNLKYFREDKTTKQIIADFKFDLQDWAVNKFKGRKNAVTHFQKLGDTVTEKTFDNWKNKG